MDDHVHEKLRSFQLWFQFLYFLLSQITKILDLLRHLLFVVKMEVEVLAGSIFGFQAELSVGLVGKTIGIWHQHRPQALVLGGVHFLKRIAFHDLALETQAGIKLWRTRRIEGIKHSVIVGAWDGCAIAQPILHHDVEYWDSFPLQASVVYLHISWELAIVIQNPLMRVIVQVAWDIGHFIFGHWLFVCRRHPVWLPLLHRRYTSLLQIWKTISH